VSYTYDAVGNRLTEQINGGAAVNYVYDAANRLTSVGAQNYTWDNNGNLTNDGASAYTYDSANRLKQVMQGGVTYTFAYNGQGDRVKQTIGAATTNYVLDLNAPLTQLLADGTNTYLYGSTRIGEEQPSGFAYHLPDALGSVRQLTNATANATLTRAYEPFGAVTSATGNGSSIFGYAGEAKDATGLIFLRARYYHPAIGRFFGRDTWPGSYQMPGTLHPYLYGMNNPILYTDPSGRCADPLTMLLCGRP
jgi:RHS repeat-associated protein